MIQILALRNAQRHERAAFEFHKGVNAIVGATDAGKSTVARSLRWALFNKPANLNILRRGTKKTEVAFTLDTGEIVARVRTKTKNYYVFEGVDKKGFGKTVPDEIAQVIDMDDTLHVQRQSDPYFMLALSSPTECAKQLERYTDLSIISTSVQRARKSVFAIKTELRHVREALRPLRETVEALSGSTALNSDVLLLYKRYEGYTGNVQRLERCKYYRDILLSLQSELATVRQRSQLDLSGAAVSLEALRIREDVLARLRGCADRLEASKRIEKVETVLPVSEMAGIEKRVNLLLQSEDKELELKKLRSKWEYLQEELEDAAKEVTMFDKQLGQYKRCPTCGQAIEGGQRAKETIHRGGRCTPNESESNLPY